MHPLQTAFLPSSTNLAYVTYDNPLVFCHPSVTWLDSEETPSYGKKINFI